MKKINNIREIIVSLTAFSILIWAFSKNQILGKIIIIPFLICSLAIFFKKNRYLHSSAEWCII